MDISDLQATVTAGSCSSRVIFNVPKSRSQGVEAEFAAAPNDNFDFAISAQLQRLRAAVHADSPLRRRRQRVPASRRATACRRVPEFQFVGRRHLPVADERQASLGYVTGTYQHVGSRFTQVGDQAAGRDREPALVRRQHHRRPADAEHVQLRPGAAGLRHRSTCALGCVQGKWDVALFVNNLTDERAFLALDRERGTRARVGYLTNQPRTFGLTARVAF